MVGLQLRPQPQRASSRPRAYAPRQAGCAARPPVRTTTDAARACPAPTDRGPEPAARGRDTDTRLSSLRALSADAAVGLRVDGAELAAGAGPGWRAGREAGWGFGGWIGADGGVVVAVVV